MDHTSDIVFEYGIFSVCETERKTLAIHLQYFGEATEVSDADDISKLQLTKPKCSMRFAKYY